MVDLEKVATGEYWLGTRAHTLNLVDELRTSDDHLMSLRDEVDLYEVHYKITQKFCDKVFSMFSRLQRNSLINYSEPTQPPSLT